MLICLMSGIVGRSIRSAEIMNEVGPIDVLVNNAGFGLFERLKYPKHNGGHVRVNVLGLIQITRALP